MAENVAAVTNQLIQINKDTNQQLQENQDAQKGFFNRLGAIFSKGTLSPTQQKEKDQEQKGLFTKLGDKFQGLSNSFTGFFKKYGGQAKEFGLKTLKGFAFGLFLMGVLKFLQSDLFKVLLDKVQDFLGYFDNFGAKLNAFLKDPSFSSLVDLFAASGPIALALGALFVLFNPLTTMTALFKASRFFIGLFTKGGAVTKNVDDVGKELGKKGLFSKLRGGVTSMIDGIKNLGTKIGTQAARFGSKALNMAGSGFNALKNGVASMYTGMNNLGSKIGNVLKQGAGGLDRGMSRAMGAGGKLVKGAASGFAKTALGALKFAGPVGLIATAAMTVGSGVMAGIDAYKKTGEVGTAIKEGFAGAVSSLTLGFVSQETISEGMTKIGDSVSGAFNKVKDAYVSGFNNVKDGITKVVNDPEGAFNAVSDKLSELTGLDLPSFDESKKAISDMADRLKTGFEDFTGIKLPTSLDEAKTRLTEGLSSLGDSLSKKFSNLKEGVGGFFSKMFGGDEEGDPNTQLTETVKLKQEEINSLNQKLADASKMSIANQTELAEMREQIVNLSKQLETQQSGANVTTVNSPSQMVNNTQATTVMPTMIDNGSQPAGVGATA